jgi:cytochrome c-type biogenesis protein CcmH/NrfG
MGNGNQETPNATWTSTQAYVLAVICLVVGLGAGYLVRGSAGAGDVAAAVPQQQQAPTAMGGNGAQPTPEQMKRMADKEAEPLLEALKNNPKDFDALAQLGNIYYDTENFDTAVQYYGKALEVRPGNANVRTDMGTAYFRLGDSDRAIKEFETALKSDPKHAQTMFNLGMVKWQGKADVNGAVAAWQRLLQTAPDYPERAKVEQLIAQAKQHSNIKPGTKTDKPATMPASM